MIPARNEAVVLPRLLAALDRLDYPAHLLSFVLVDDGSTDATRQIAEAWVAGRRNARTVHLTKSLTVGTRRKVYHVAGNGALGERQRPGRF